MNIARVVAYCLLLGAGFNASAQSPVQALIPTLMPVAAKARDGIVNHPRLASFEIEAIMRETVKKATGVMKGPNDVSAARAILAPLEQTIGPLRQLPLFELHRLLGYLAGLEGKSDEQNYHRAYSVALLLSIDKSGNGTSPESAYRVVMIVEEYDWFAAQRGLKQQTRVAREMNGRKYDVWTARIDSGEERQIYFDVTGMQESAARVLNARNAAKSNPVQQ